MCSDLCPCTAELLQQKSFVHCYWGTEEGAGIPHRRSRDAFHALILANLSYGTLLSSEKGEEIEKYHGPLLKDTELKILKMPRQ